MKRKNGDQNRDRLENVEGRKEGSGVSRKRREVSGETSSPDHEDRLGRRLN